MAATRGDRLVISLTSQPRRPPWRPVQGRGHAYCFILSDLQYRDRRGQDQAGGGGSTAAAAKRSPWATTRASPASDHVPESPETASSKPPWVRTLSGRAARPRWRPTAAPASTPVPQERVSSSTP